MDLNSNDITGTGNINITGTITASGNFGAINTGSNAITTTGTLNVGTISFDTNGWTVEENASNELIFKYNGTNKMKIDTSGNLTVTGNVTAYGTV